MENINVFVYSKLKLINDRPTKVVSWITILIITFILFLIISIFLKFHIFSRHIGYIELNNNYNLKIIVDDKSFPIKSNYKLYIDNKKYEYKILSVEKQIGYYEILVSCNLDDDLLINNNIVTITFQKEETTLIKEIIKKLKKGLI